MKNQLAVLALMLAITVQVTDTAGYTAISPPDTCVAPGKILSQYSSYDYEEKSENTLKQVRVWIPGGLKTVRGILVVSNPSSAVVDTTLQRSIITGIQELFRRQACEIPMQRS
jgi:hypothetical protein